MFTSKEMLLLQTAFIAGTLPNGFSGSPVNGQDTYCYQCYNLSEKETCTNIAPCESGCVSECFEENNAISLHHYCEDNAPCKDPMNTARLVGHRFCNGSLCNTPSKCTDLQTTPKTTLKTTITPLLCDVCNSSTCGNTPTIVRCPEHQPYCLTSINETSGAGRLIEKRCASNDECNILWWKGSSDKLQCQSFSENTTSRFVKLDCTYCCSAPDRCNVNLYPDMGTMFIGTSN